MTLILPQKKAVASDLRALLGCDKVLSDGPSLTAYAVDASIYRMVPQAVALADTSFAPIAGAATVQVAASVIVTAVLTPLLTAWWYKRVINERAAVSQATTTATAAPSRDFV